VKARGGTRQALGLLTALSLLKLYTKPRNNGTEKKGSMKERDSHKHNTLAIAKVRGKRSFWSFQRVYSKKVMDGSGVRCKSDGGGSREEG